MALGSIVIPEHPKDRWSNQLPRTLYSYRRREEVPLLTEEEFAPIAEILDDFPQKIAAMAEERNCTLQEAETLLGQPAFEHYKMLTGIGIYRMLDFYTLRLSSYGRPCPNCGRPFRTPKAKFCAECGHTLPAGEVAGPATADN